VRYDTRPGARSDWTHEQEWRLHTPCLSLSGAGVQGVLVEDPAWHPNRWMRFLVRAGGTPTLDPGGAVSESTQWWAPPSPWSLPVFCIDVATGAMVELA
jgi:hypothetical protein